MATDTYAKGDPIKVTTFKTKVVGIEVLVEGFTGIFIREYKNDCGLFADVYDDEGNQRTIPIEYVKDIGDDTELEFDGETYSIKCINCGDYRSVRPQNVSQIKRCVKCQREHARKAARERINRKRGKV